MEWARWRSEIGGGENVQEAQRRQRRRDCGRISRTGCWAVRGFFESGKERAGQVGRVGRAVRHEPDGKVGPQGGNSASAAGARRAQRVT